MDIETFTIATRVPRGKGGARQQRREGQIPGTLYGGGKDPVNVTMPARAFTQLLHGKLGEHAVLKLEVSDMPEANTPALIKGVQHHPVKGNVIHADFQRIRLDQPIKTVVALHLVGRAKGIIEGGILDHQIRDIEVECLPTALPDYIEVDVTHLDIGQSIHVSEIAAPEGVTITTPDHYSVAAVLASRLTRLRDGSGDDGGEGEGEEGAGAAE